MNRILRDLFTGLSFLVLVGCPNADTVIGPTTITTSKNAQAEGADYGVFGRRTMVVKSRAPAPGPGSVIEILHISPAASSDGTVELSCSGQISVDLHFIQRGIKPLVVVNAELLILDPFSGKFVGAGLVPQGGIIAAKEEGFFSVRFTARGCTSPIEVDGVRAYVEDGDNLVVLSTAKEYKVKLVPP